MLEEVIPKRMHSKARHVAIVTSDLSKLCVTGEKPAVWVEKAKPKDKTEVKKMAMVDLENDDKTNKKSLNTSSTRLETNQMDLEVMISSQKTLALKLSEMRKEWMIAEVSCVVEAIRPCCRSSSYRRKMRARCKARLDKCETSSKSRSELD